MRFTQATIILAIICSIYLTTSVHCGDPLPPVWPKQFEVRFKETYNVDYVRRVVEAKYWYDSTRNLTRVDRDNGQYDLFCSGVVKNEKVPCQQFITRGWRYITYGSKLEKCCTCCNSSNGCDILKRNWMDGSQFVGYDEVNGLKVGKWISKKDIVDRVYIYTIDQGYPVVSWVGSDVYQEYDLKQYQ